MKICAAGILLKKGKILLGKRSADLKFYPNVWDLIGGHCKGNETPEQTLLRELQEEIGVRPTKFVHLEVLYELNSEIYGDYEYHIYLVTSWIGSPRNASDEHSELNWFNINEASNLNLAHPKYPELFKRIEMMKS
ncbi:MAG: NUDIX hydrolase [Candidatus Hermodarchaeota archaeon]